MVAREFDLIGDGLVDERLESMRRNEWGLMCFCLTPVLLQQPAELRDKRLSCWLNALPCPKRGRITNALRWQGEERCQRYATVQILHAHSARTAEQVAKIAKFSSKRLIMLQPFEPFVEKGECLLVLPLLNVLKELLFEDGILECIRTSYQWFHHQLVYLVPCALWSRSSM